MTTMVSQTLCAILMLREYLTECAFQDFHSAHGHNQDQQQPNVQDRPTMSGTGRIDASGRINWWRLYRFPPIVSPRDMSAGLRQAFAQGGMNAAGQPQADVPSSPVILADGLATSPGQSPSTHEHLSTSSIPPLSSNQPSNTDTSSSSTGPSEFNTSPNPMPTLTSSTPVSQYPLHSIVPVIVVGLQSVNSEWRPDIPTQGENEGVDFFGQPMDTNGSAGGMGMGAGGNEMNDEEDMDGWGTFGQPDGQGDANRGRGRARGWQSRAANAFRNLRPGRRTADESGVQPPLVAPGSRTFLIYVIGGMLRSYIVFVQC